MAEFTVRKWWKDGEEHFTLMPSKEMGQMFEAATHNERSRNRTTAMRIAFGFMTGIIITALVVAVVAIVALLKNWRVSSPEQASQPGQVIVKMEAKEIAETIGKEVALSLKPLLTTAIPAAAATMPSDLRIELEEFRVGFNRDVESGHQKMQKEMQKAYEVGTRLLQSHQAVAIANLKRESDALHKRAVEDERRLKTEADAADKRLQESIRLAKSSEVGLRIAEKTVEIDGWRVWSGKDASKEYEPYFYLRQPSGTYDVFQIKNGDIMYRQLGSSLLEFKFVPNNSVDGKPVVLYGDGYITYEPPESFLPSRGVAYPCKLLSPEERGKIDPKPSIPPK